jgi:hypothetical protein
MTLSSIEDPRLFKSFERKEIYNRMTVTALNDMMSIQPLDAIGTKEINI